MASFSRKKTGLKAALFAYIAGAHHIIEYVEKSQQLTQSAQTGVPEATEMRHAMLEADYERMFDSTLAIDLFVDLLEEEDLYPFGGQWPREAFADLLKKVIPPALSIEDIDAGTDLRIRFKKGFKSLLADYASAVDSDMRVTGGLDHWLVLLLNTGFHAGMVVAARNAEVPKLYYNVMQELDEEVEPWSKYHQLTDLLDRQLRRETKRKTGLVESDYEGEFGD